MQFSLLVPIVVAAAFYIHLLEYGVYGTIYIFINQFYAPHMFIYISHSVFVFSDRDLLTAIDMLYT